MLVPNVDNLNNNDEEVLEKIVEIDDIFDQIPLLEPISLTDEKKLDETIKLIEKMVRGSYEYRKFIGHLKNNLDLTRCAFHKDVDISILRKTSLEFHHYPFTLYDIVSIVIISKFENDDKPEILDYFELAEEVIELHFELCIGLVPLSKTVHQLAHSGKKFINLNLVYGKYLKFISKFQNYISDDLINNWHMLKDLSNQEDLGELTEDILDNIELRLDIKGLEKAKPIVIENYDIETA